MGRVAEYSEEQIITAGNYIESIGKHVTAFSIREKLGGGSPERIKGVWEQHIRKLQNESATNYEEDKIELPAEIQDSLDQNLKTSAKQIESIAKESFKVAMEVAESRVKSVIEKHEGKIAEYELSEKEAFQALNQSDNEIQSLESQIATLKQHNDQLVAKNSNLTGKLESLKERIKQLELKETDYTKLVHENGELKGQLKVLTLN